MLPPHPARVKAIDLIKQVLGAVGALPPKGSSGCGKSRPVRRRRGRTAEIVVEIGTE